MLFRMQLIKELKESFIALKKIMLVHGVILQGILEPLAQDLTWWNKLKWTKRKSIFGWIIMMRLKAMVHYPKPFVCAITGFAPAGGTILTLCADYRIMAQEPKHVIGMHEFKLSMIVPELMMDFGAIL